MKRNNLIFVAIAIFAITIFSCNDEQLLVNTNTNNTRMLNTTNGDDSEVTEYYYWYHGRKVFLKRNDQKQYVVYNNDIDRQTYLNNETFNNQLNEMHYARIKPLDGDKVREKKLKWRIIERANTKAIDTISMSHVAYSSPFYTSSIGDEIGISHLFYVKLKSKEDENLLINMAENYKVDVIGNDEFLPLWYTLSCDNQSYGDALKMSNVFYESGLFEAAEPDIMVDLAMSSSSSFSPNDTYFNRQWNLVGTNSINWSQAYQLAKGDNVNVAIIDEGIEHLHPDLPSVFNGYDTVSQNVDVGNVVYGPHGTACAGIIAALVNNNKGISGIAPNATIFSVCHPLKASPNAIQQLANGLEIACLSNDVVSCSWGGNSLTSSMIEDALYYYAFTWGRNGKGTVVVFATGNSNSNVAFPANCNENIIAVGAITTNGRRANFSNYGTELDVVAPGDYIPTTDAFGSNGYEPSDYKLDFDGTSAACPHVAGVAALMLSVNPNLTGEEVAEIIEKTACKVGGYAYSTVSNRPNGIWNREMGYGLVDAYAAVSEAINRK